MRSIPYALVPHRKVCGGYRRFSVQFRSTCRQGSVNAQQKVLLNHIWSHIP